MGKKADCAVCRLRPRANGILCEKCTKSWVLSDNIDPMKWGADVARRVEREKAKTEIQALQAQRDDAVALLQTIVHVDGMYDDDLTEWNAAMKNIIRFLREHKKFPSM